MAKNSHGLPKRLFVPKPGYEEYEDEYLQEGRAILDAYQDLNDLNGIDFGEDEPVVGVYQLVDTGLVQRGEAVFVSHKEGKKKK